jgi:hypothetical protein
LPASLTDPLDYPPSLPERFTDNEMWDLIFNLYDVVDQANDDRARAGRIASGAKDENN